MAMKRTTDEQQANQATPPQLTRVGEIERKYAVDEGTALPLLLDLPGVESVGQPVEQALSATYFDTADLALARARVTLRRRTGGEDAGWHLKLPAGPGSDERTEVRLPLGRAVKTVPPALVAPVRAIVRDHPLGPVAQIDTHRVVHRLSGGDSVLAEFCDDTVSASRPGDGQRQQWREWEVELGSGDAALLDAAQAAVLGAGGSPAPGPSKLARALGVDAVQEGPEQPRPSRKGPAARVVHALLAEQVAELESRDPQVRRDEEDAVHKMRVATRRLRSALGTFRPLFDRAMTDPIRDELRWLAALLGEARDAEVMRDRLTDLVDAQPAELVLGPVPRRVQLDLTGSYRRHHDDVLRGLDDRRYFRLLDALDALVAHPPWSPLAEGRARDVLPGRVHHAYKAVQRAARRAARTSGPEHDEHLHEVRKAAKRLRYVSEAVVVPFGRPAEQLAGAAKQLQEVLGEHHDTVVTRAALRQLGVEANGDGESAFTYGRLHALEEDRGQRLADEYAVALRRARGKRFRALR